MANHDDLAAHAAARDAVRKLHARGLPSGIDPAVATAVVAENMPVGYEIARMVVRRVGTEYDAALVAGAKDHRARPGVGYVLEAMLVATLAEHGGGSWAEACARLWRAQGADPPQGDDDWAFLMGCAFHPCEAEDAATLVALGLVTPRGSSVIRALDVECTKWAIRGARGNRRRGYDHAGRASRGSAARRRRSSGTRHA